MKFEMKSYLDAGGCLRPVVVDGTIMRANRHHLDLYFLRVQNPFLNICEKRFVQYEFTKSNCKLDVKLRT